MKLSVQSFGGLAPSLNPRYLAENRAQTAQNVRMAPGGGALRPLTGLLNTGQTVGVSAVTLYRYGQSSGTGTQQWLSWDTDVDVVRSQISGDTEEWTHYTGDGAPKSIYASALQTPVSMGIPGPENPPTLLVVGDPPSNSNESPESRVYIVTFVRTLAGLTAESVPSPASLTADVYGSTQTVNVTLPSLPLQSTITHLRLYRATAGTYLFVAEYSAALAGTTVNDAVLADALGEECPSLLWTPPPDDLTGLVNLPNGIVAGFVGRDVYFCEPYRPYAWPQVYVYNRPVDYPIVGLGAIDTTLVVLTTGEPYFVQGTHPDSMTTVNASIPQACVAKRSIVSLNGAVYYASPDGLMRISPGASELVTRELYQRDDWQALAPDTFQAFGHDLQYIAFHVVDGVRMGWIYDLNTGEVTRHNVAVSAGYADLLEDTLYVKRVGEGTVYAWNRGATLTATWRSKVFTMPHPMPYAAAQVLAEAYPVTLNVYGDGVLLRTMSLTSESPVRLPPGRYRDWELEVVTTAEVYAMTIAQGIEELRGG